MFETFLLRDMAFVMSIAAAMTLLCHYFKQPVVIGYLLAGLIIGPHTPPFALVRDMHSIHTMAELGLVFLMLSLGLEFSLPKLRKVGFPALLGASFEVLGMFATGYWLGGMFGWTSGDSIFLGAILSMSSTTIIVKVFMDLKLIKAAFVKVVFGILIIEDIVAVLILSFLSGFAGSGGDRLALLATSLIKVLFFIVLFLVLGLWLVPRLLSWVARFQVREVLGITVLGLCLASAFLASQFGLSVALGAFLSGAVIAASKEIGQVEEWIPSVRDMFSAIFFVSAGMMIQPHILWAYKWHILVIAFATLLGKVVTDTVGCLLAGLDLKTSFKVGFSLGQIGEFSFVIATLGSALKVTSDFFFPLAVGVSAVTTLCTPYLIKNSDIIVSGLMRITPKGFLDALTHYQSRFRQSENAFCQNQKTSVFAKYLVRLVVYLILAIGMLGLIYTVSRLIFSGPAFDLILFVVWVIATFLCIPFVMLICKYANHIFFLWVTRFPRVLELIHVNRFYNTSLSVFFAIVGTVYWVISWNIVKGLAQSWQVPAAIIFLSILLRRQLAIVTEKMEQVLDEILGLATSEPNRQAVLAGEKTAFLHGVMEPISLSAGQWVIGRSIRELKLREKTGASVVAIYRDGKHVSNPSPDTQLQENDILIVIGNDDERGQAKDVFMEKDRISN